MAFSARMRPNCSWNWVIVADQLPRKELNDNPDAKELISSGIKVIAGSHPIELLDESFSFMVKNPGIPYNNPMVKRALELEIPVLTEVELRAEILEGRLIGVTGTNGKTTTTTMITDLLNAGRKIGKAYKAGKCEVPECSFLLLLAIADVTQTSFEDRC